ncbi:MAG TPA: N-formylglutamate amidohydrolase [Burkholderiales bacterium]|nr:N-formylglutamate amidohydrolase [Burkholderiales bacterium]
MKVIITCEHGGNRIPAKYRPLFRKHRALLESHRGYDPGALALARDFAAALDAELVYSTTSRLLVELNRSRHHPRLFSEVSRDLPGDERQRVLERYYEPYRSWVDEQVRQATSGGGSIVHLSCHSFTPRLHGVERRTDVGLLYDPGRSGELRLCLAWQRALSAAAPKLKVRRNYPYRGYNDGVTTSLRRRYGDALYAGVELEVNQKHPLGDAAGWRALRTTLVTAFIQALCPSC